MARRTSVFLWRKLDAPGHDSCRLSSTSSGCVLEGAAVFVESGRACHIGYRVVADSSLRTRSARVTGFIGKKGIDLRIEARRGRWTVNGVEQPRLDGCLDLDLGFTPATNLLAIRRLGLSIGEEAQAPAVYLEFPKTRLGVLAQRYKRLSRTEYAYEAPRFGYRATLRVSAAGAVIEYPGLFAMEHAG